MTERIEGKVAAIISEREVALNLGKSAGVREGMRFAILAKTPIEIRDPDSQRKLGEEDRAKVKVQATQVHPEYSIAETYQVYEVVTGGLDLGFSGMTDLFRPRQVEKRVQTLRLKDATGPPPLPPEESFVEIGDRVVHIAE